MIVVYLLMIWGSAFLLAGFWQHCRTRDRERERVREYLDRSISEWRKYLRRERYKGEKGNTQRALYRIRVLQEARMVLVGDTLPESLLQG